MKRLICLSWIVIMILATSAAVAQSLAEIAKKEKERRNQIDSSESRTVTEVELRRAGGPRTGLSSTPPSQTTDSDDVAEDDEEEEDQEETVDERQTEDYWRKRLAPIDNRIKSMEERLQSPQFTSNPYGASDRKRLEGQIAQARAERQTVIDEARRKGVPPGWLR